MGNFISSLSGQLAKSIVFGTFFPVVLFVIILTSKILPLAGVRPQALFAALLPFETDSAVPAVTAFALIVIVLLYSFNIPLIRLYEGYPWLSSWLGQWCAARQRARFRLAADALARIRVLERQAREAGIADALPAGLTTLRVIAGNIGNAFPDREDTVLPTRLGNVIRAFEVYPKTRYGIQAIPVWPRLAQILPAEKAAAIDDAKSSFDFMFNCSVLAVISSVLFTAVGLANDHPFRWVSGVQWVPWTGAFLVLAYLFYLGAVDRAAAWGTQVKVAFDLYRFDLLGKLGYKTEISGPEEEQALWEEISYQLIYPNTPHLPKLPYKNGQTTLSVRPLSVVIASRRNVEWTAANTLKVTLVVRNTDQARQKATSVEIREKIEKGWRVIKNTVSLDGTPADISSLDPLTVATGELTTGVEKTLVYEIEKHR